MTALGTFREWHVFFNLEECSRPPAQEVGLWRTCDLGVRQSTRAGNEVFSLFEQFEFCPYRRRQACGLLVYSELNVPKCDGLYSSQSHRRDEGCRVR